MCPLGLVSSVNHRVGPWIPQGNIRAGAAWTGGCCGHVRSHVHGARPLWRGKWKWPAYGPNDVNDPTSEIWLGNCLGQLRPFPARRLMGK
jgi:hypothetical protein